MSTSIFDGRTSTYPQGGGTVASYFQTNAAKTGAQVFIASGGNVMFLGPAFFNPEDANVKADYTTAQAFMLLHEAVHLVTSVRDNAFGPPQEQCRKNLTRFAGSHSSSMPPGTELCLARERPTGKSHKPAVAPPRTGQGNLTGQRSSIRCLVRNAR